MTTTTTTTAMTMLVVILFCPGPCEIRVHAHTPVSMGVPSIGSLLQIFCDNTFKSVHSAMEEHVGTNGALWLQRHASLVEMQFSPCLHVFHIFHTMQVEV